jgi:hypothetical protein
MQVCGIVHGKTGRCPLWVISGHLHCNRPCPLYPRKQTLSSPSKSAFGCRFTAEAKTGEGEGYLSRLGARYGCDLHERRLEIADGEEPKSAHQQSRLILLASSVVQRHLAEALLRSRRDLQLLDERQLIRWLRGVHSHHSQVAHLAAHAVQLLLQQFEVGHGSW